MLTHHPESAHAHDLAGHVNHVVRSEPIPAEDHFRRAIALEPEDPSSYATLGIFLADRGRLEEGITVARKGLRIDPSSVRVLQALQTLYRLNREPELADEMGERAMKLDPEAAEHHLELGLRLLHRRDKGAARSSFLESLRLSPADADNKDLIAHERVQSHPFFKNGIFLSFERGIVIPAVVVPAIWFGLGLLFRPFVYLGWASIVVLVLAYAYHGLFLLCRWHVRRQIDRGRV